MPIFICNICTCTLYLSNFICNVCTCTLYLSNFICNICTCTLYLSSFICNVSTCTLYLSNSYVIYVLVPFICPTSYVIYVLVRFIGPISYVKNVLARFICPTNSFEQSLVLKRIFSVVFTFTSITQMKLWLYRTCSVVSHCLNCFLSIEFQSLYVCPFQWLEFIIHTMHTLAHPSITDADFTNIRYVCSWTSDPTYFQYCCRLANRTTWF